MICEISVLGATQEMEKKKKANRKSWRDWLCKRRNPMDVLRPRTFVATIFGVQWFFFVKPDPDSAIAPLLMAANNIFMAQGFRL